MTCIGWTIPFFSLLISVTLIFYISCNLSTSFFIRALLKHCVSSLSILRNIWRKDGVNFLKSSCRLISTGRSMCFSFSSFWIRSFGCSYFESSYYRQS